MSHLIALFIAFGLAADAFAVSMASGAIIKQVRVKHAALFGAVFGGFQMLMPLIGWWLGVGFKQLITNIDHWIAFVLLVFVGAKMVKESFGDDEEKSFNPLNPKTLLALGVATSIDALAVGFSLSVLGSDLIIPVLIIGGVTFATSFAGVYLGKVFGHILEKKVTFAGGLILIAIGLKILLEHMAA
jgi:putative Mn2+ efflux pump MntP